MSTKTFKIGECAIGGVIKVDTSATKITVTVIDWNSKKALPGHAAKFPTKSGSIDIIMFLEDKTTSYWADKIIEWIKSAEGEDIFDDIATFKW